MAEPRLCVAAGADEVLLRSGDWRAAVSPFGASLRRLWLEPASQPRRDVLWGYSGREAKKGGQGDVLMPWPGRIAGGTYTFSGARQELARNDKDGPNAIHGFLRGRLWEEGPRMPSTAQFRTRIGADDHPGYPFELEVVLGYELLPSGLACAFVVRNAGASAAPFGAGFHPYVLTDGGVDGAEVEVPAGQLVEFADLLPTGRVLDAPPSVDFRGPRRVGDARLNHCLTGLERDAGGFARVRVGDVVLWMDASFPYLVLYTGDALGPDARRSLAVEPMTCATDAFNRPEMGLRILEPGEVFAGTWGVAVAGTA